MRIVSNGTFQVSELAKGSGADVVVFHCCATEALNSRRDVCGPFQAGRFIWTVDGVLAAWRMETGSDPRPIRYLFVKRGFAGAVRSPAALGAERRVGVVLSLVLFLVAAPFAVSWRLTFSPYRLLWR